MRNAWNVVLMVLAVFVLMGVVVLLTAKSVNAVPT